jgi:hypothetical protein
MFASGAERAVRKPAILIPRNEPDFKTLFESFPGLCLILRSDLTIVDASDAYLQATLTRREEISRCHLFDVFPDNPGDPDADGVDHLNASLHRVLATGVLDHMAVQRYDVRDQISGRDQWIEKHWLLTNSPVAGRERRQIAYIIHHVEDVTDLVQLRRYISERGLINFAAGNPVPTSAIYDVLHAPRCAKHPQRQALWAGDTFPVHGCCGHEVWYRLYSRFDWLNVQ